MCSAPEWHFAPLSARATNRIRGCCAPPDRRTARRLPSGDRSLPLTFALCSQAVVGHLNEVRGAPADARSRARRQGLRCDSSRIWGPEGPVPRSHRAARRGACGAQLSRRGARGTSSAYPVHPTHRCRSSAARAPGGRAAVQHAHRCGSSARTAPRLQPAVQGLHRSGSSACSAQCVRHRCVVVLTHSLPRKRPIPNS